MFKRKFNIKRITKHEDNVLIDDYYLVEQYSQNGKNKETEFIINKCDVVTLLELLKLTC